MSVSHSFIEEYPFALHKQTGIWYRVASGDAGEVIPASPEAKPLSIDISVSEAGRALKFWAKHGVVYDPKVFGPMSYMTWTEALFQVNRGDLGKV